MGTYSANEPMIPITPSPIRGGDLDVPVISSRDRCVPLPRNSLTEHLDDHGNPHKVTAEQVGAYSKSSVYTRSEVDAKVASVDVSDELSKIGETLKAKADLVNGVVPIDQLPSYGSDVLEYSMFSKLPATGETSKIYITLDTNLIYRWGGSGYIEISAGTPVTLDTDHNKIIVGDTSIEVAPKSHVSDTGNPHGVTAKQVGAYTKSEVDDKLSGKLDSTAISEWAKGKSKPTYTASEVGVTLNESTNEITIDNKSIKPLTTESDPVFTKWKDGTSVALGANATSENYGEYVNDNYVVVGASATVRDSETTALGYKAEANEASSTALGANSAASGMNSTALGSSASASDSSVALGHSASASYNRSVAIGDNATLNGTYATAIGQGAYANGTSATAIGQGAYAKDNCFGVTYTPDNFFFNSKASESGAVAKSLQEYLNEKADASAIPKLDGYAKTDDVRDKLDLSVYSKYTEWYIIDNDYPPNVLAKMEGGGVTFTCDAEVYSGQEHLNKITVYVSYDTTTGKVSGVSGGAQTWYPLSVGDQPPAYISSELLPDSDAVNMINDPDNGCFSAISYYFDENGQRQSGMVRFKVEYTGARQKLDDTLVKTSDLTFANIKSLSFAAPTLADGLGYFSNGEETVYKNGLVNYWYNDHVANFKFPDPSTLEGSSGNSYTLATTTDLSQYRELTDDKVYNKDGTDSGNTYVDSKTFNELAAKVDTANATLEEVV